MTSRTIAGVLAGNAIWLNAMVYAAWDRKPTLANIR
jgi:hypothetical protein